MDHFGTPGVAVSVVYDDVVLFSKGYGVREVDKTDPITPDTVFSLASMSKPISGTALAHLVARGVIAWDEPVHGHAPGLRFSDPWITSTSRSRTSTRTAAACPGCSATPSSTSATRATRSWPASR
jgi:CubicO group peptidase (beta-lactamase class C family)